MGTGVKAAGTVRYTSRCVVVCCRYWLVNCPEAVAGDAAEICVTLADELYGELIAVPYMAKFVVFAKRRDETHGLVRVFVVTDDKLDKTLESHQRFLEVARSDDVEVQLSRPPSSSSSTNLTSQLARTLRCKYRANL